VILLDTNALIWLEQGHRRARPLLRRPSLAVSPASLLELQFLTEARRIKMRGEALEALVHDDRWIVDEPPAVTWFQRAAELPWTRDPFDRLIAAHARLRGWPLATADARMLEHLAASERIAL
jgi:PIN domain nuclease of toxin-antitoxin system